MKFGITLAVCISAIGALSSLSAQSLTMDGESGIFFQPWALTVPSDHGSFGGTTMSVHTVGLSPVFGSLYNVGVGEGFGGFLEFGYTRNFHTDGGNPNISPLVSFNGMNLFNVKAVILKGGYKKAKYVPAVSVGGVLRTNDPYISQKLAGHTITNGDIYVVGTETFPLTKKFAVRLSGGVRGTNAETNGFDGVARWSLDGYGPRSRTSFTNSQFESKQLNRVCHEHRF